MWEGSGGERGGGLEERGGEYKGVVMRCGEGRGGLRVDEREGEKRGSLGRTGAGYGINRPGHVLLHNLLL